MNLSERDRRALIFLAVAGAIALAVNFWPEPAVETVGGAEAETVRAAASRLDRIRAEAAQAPVRQEALTKTREELAQMEKGLIGGESQAQVQAQLLQIFRRAARAQSPAVDARQTQFGQIRPFGEGYAQVTLSVSLECQIEQLINLIADLSAQPEMLALEELRISATDNKQKAIGVQMVVSGLTHASLIPKAGTQL